VIVAFEVVSPDPAEVTAFAGDTDVAWRAIRSIDRQGDRMPLVLNFIAGAGDLSRYRTGLRSHSCSPARQAAPAEFNSCLRGKATTKAFYRIALRPIRRYRRA
jgi:hypothetical protein